MCSLNHIKSGGFRVYGNRLTGRLNKQVDYRKETKYSTRQEVQSNKVQGCRMRNSTGARCPPD